MTARASRPMVLFLCCYSQREESIFQCLRHRTCRLFQNQFLVVVKELDTATVEEMQEMTKEANAIENDNLGAHLTIKALRIVIDFTVYRLGGDEDVIVNARAVLSDFLDAFLNVCLQHCQLSS